MEPLIMIVANLEGKELCEAKDLKPYTERQCADFNFTNYLLLENNGALSLCTTQTRKDLSDPCYCAEYFEKQHLEDAIWFRARTNPHLKEMYIIELQRSFDPVCQRAEIIRSLFAKETPQNERLDTVDTVVLADNKFEPELRKVFDSLGIETISKYDGSFQMECERY